MKKDSEEIVEETEASEQHTLSQGHGEGNASKTDWDEIVEESKASEEHTPSEGLGESDASSKENEEDAKKDLDEVAAETKASEERTPSQGQGLSESAANIQMKREKHRASERRLQQAISSSNKPEEDTKKDLDETVEETKVSEEPAPSHGQGEGNAASKEKEKDVKTDLDKTVEESKACEEHTSSQGQEEGNVSSKENEKDVKTDLDVEETKASEEHNPSQGQGEGNAASNENEKDVKTVSGENMEETKASEEPTQSQGQGEGNAASMKTEKNVKRVSEETVEETKASEEPTLSQGQGEGNASSKENEKDTRKDLDETVEETKVSEEHASSQGRGEGDASSNKPEEDTKKDLDETVEETKVSEEPAPSHGQGEGNAASKEKEKDVKKVSDETVEESKACEEHTSSQGKGEGNVSCKKIEMDVKTDLDETVEENKASEEHTPSQGQGEAKENEKDETAKETKAIEEPTQSQDQGGDNAASKEKDVKKDVEKKDSQATVKELSTMAGKKVPPANKEEEDSQERQQEANETHTNDQDDEITPESDLSDLSRRIWVVTTASLPWRTGTAVNPLARALYLTRGRPKHHVGLVIPWLESQEDQAKIYGSDSTFETQQDQEAWIRNYAKERVHCEKETENLKILFYPAVYHDLFGSIFATEDICSLIPDEEADVAILEEPEHLNWFRVPPHIEDGVDDSTRETLELGWTAKFKHVVGILHTNYSAYMQQYGMGTSFIAASALGALSSIVVRGHCHRLIRLSATLPELNAPKEVTCNVHGVRLEFLEPPEPAKADAEDHFQPVPIYFIGKLIWAKGFDNVLTIQEMFKDATGDYFPIDVYGSGGDEKAIKRAFWGRKGITSAASDISENGRKIQEMTSPVDLNAALVFGVHGSLRGQIDASENIEILMKDTLVQRQQAQQPAAAGADLARLTLDLTQPLLSQSITLTYPSPLEILGDLSGKTFMTGGATTTAIGNLTNNLVKLGFHISFSKETHEDAEKATSEDGDEKECFHFDPPQSRFELRRQAIPARFLGTKDHAFLRDMVGHKIFLNMSETEVLCTTTAEALAMGKFAIIPKHPSNTFFEQFANCLVYENKMECVVSVKWALENDPKPLSEKEHFMLTWEGANERLYKSSALTKKEVEEWNESGATKADRQCARLHMETLKKGHFIQKFIPGMH